MKRDEVKPIAPYSGDGIATQSVLDRATGEPIATERLKSYAEALCHII